MIHRPDNTPQPGPPKRFPTEYPIGTVLSFQKKYARGIPYSYITVRVSEGLWYLTGRETRAYTWDELVVFIGKSSCRIVTEWEDIA